MDTKSRTRSWWLPLVLFGFILLCTTPAHAMNVTLAWDANTESDLAGYKVYYGTSSGGPYNGTGASGGSSPIVIPLSSLANRSLPEYSVNNLPNATHYFVLTAYDSEGLESGYSNQVTVSPPVTQYQLSASVVGGNGAISPTSGTYNTGTVVNLTATPASGYRVLSWTGTNNSSSTATTNTVTMSANKSVTVTFEQIPATQYQLSASVTGGNGAISPTSGTYSAGTVVNLTATPASGYRVLSWTGTNNNGSTSTTNTVTMSANKSVSVTFEQIPATQYQLSASVVGGNGAISPTSGTYSAGTVVNVTATPASGYRVLSWTGTGNNSSTSTTNTVTMSANKSVSVTFEQIPATQYQLSASVVGGNGAISPTSGTYSAGTVVNVTATPASGYRVLSWTGTNNNSSTATTNTVTMSSNKSVTVSFGAVPNGSPAISSFIVGGQSGASSVYTNSAARQISIRIVASDDVALSQYLILDNQSDPTGKTFFTIPGAGQKTADFTISFALNDTDGNRTLYAWVKDAQGLISVVTSKPNVVLDRVAPTVALSYSKPNAYKAGDAILLTANFSDNSAISGIPKISINYAGTGNDLSNVNMTQASNAQWTYNLTIPSGNNGVATVTLAATDMAGNAAGTPSGNTFTIDNAGPSVVGLPAVDYVNNSITITYSEAKMLNAASQASYSFNNGLLLSGNATDVNGDAKVFRLPLNASSFNKFIIYTMTISSNVTDAAGNFLPSTGRSFQVNDADNDGMADAWEIQWFGSITAKNGTADTDKDGLTDKEEYLYSRQNPTWGWKLNPTKSDSDNDGMPDGFEMKYALNPTNATDKDLDSDHDGWTNLQEYQKGTNPNDASSTPETEAPRVKSINDKKQVMPKESESAANDSSFAVLLEASIGIDTADSTAVVLTISDGTNTYNRPLLYQNSAGDSIVQVAPVKGNGSTANELWVVYYRSGETSLSKLWPLGAQVTVSVMAKDVGGNSMKAAEQFKIAVETQAENNARMSNRPESSTSSDAQGTKTITNLDTQVSVSYTDDVPVTPYFDSEAAFEVVGPELRTVVVSLGPHMVFPNGATIFIPSLSQPIGSGSDLMVYGYDGEQWTPIIDSNGNDLTDGSWVVPGWNNGLSWQLVNEADRSGIIIKVWHFSSFAGASGGSLTDTGASGGESRLEKLGCFITTIMK